VRAAFLRADEERPLPPRAGQFAQVAADVRAALDLEMPSVPGIEAATASGRVGDPEGFAREHARLRERVAALDTELSMNGMGFSRQGLEKAAEAAAELVQLHALVQQ
jgi:hypothetical protein